MALTHWLIDKSAYVRLGRATSPEWPDRISRGLVRLAGVTRLELGFSTRSGADARRFLTTPPMTLMPVKYLTPAMEDRACAVQTLLAERGYHRAVSVADLIVAATAELGGLVVLHVDKDFELIAEITRQPTERLAYDDPA